MRNLLKVVQLKRVVPCLLSAPTCCRAVKAAVVPPRPSTQFVVLTGWSSDLAAMLAATVFTS